MRIDIVTLFPGMFDGPLTESILQRAREEELLDIHFHDLRPFGLGKHHQIDDRPYGGGAGMVMRADVLVEAIEASSYQLPSFAQSSHRVLRPASKATGGKLAASAKGKSATSSKPYRIYLSPQGKRLTQACVERLSKKPWLLLVCGHYEGIDQRVIDGGWIDEEISIGDYVLTGGELPAMVLIDALARQIPGVLGKEESAHDESFSKSLKRKREYPHYTRPEEFKGMKVPDVLLSGHHKEIEQWRKKNIW